MRASSTHLTVGTTWDNRANLSPIYYREVIAPLEGTRMGRQEINAEILDDLPGALWTRAMIDKAREPRKLPDMSRIVVAVDPSGAKSMAEEEIKSRVVASIANRPRRSRRLLPPQDVGDLHREPLAASSCRNAARSQLCRDLAQRHPPLAQGQARAAWRSAASRVALLD